LEGIIPVERDDFRLAPMQFSTLPEFLDHHRQMMRKGRNALRIRAALTESPSERQANWPQSFLCR
jgi:hypothetical protein